MNRAITALAEHVRRNPTVLREIAANPDRVASRFGFNKAESQALRTDNFNVFGSSIGASRSLRASNHDDAYLS
jgi:hypothetical protein